MAKKEPKERPIMYRRAAKPNFIKLKPGEMQEGIYMGRGKGRFGYVYRFKGEDGAYQIGGNRVQLDQIFEDLHNDPGDFTGGPEGHYMVVVREENVVSGSGQTVAVFGVGHVFDKCPKGCTPRK